MEQTAVEWLEKRFLETEGNLYAEDFTKAKEMEKQHLYNFYVQGGVDAIMEADRNVEDLYNETFKNTQNGNR